MPDNAQSTAQRPLSQLAIGDKGIVARICGPGDLAVSKAIDPEELERRLLEIGFLEGEEIEMLHQGPIGGDPIAVNISGTVVALRRREADAVIVSI